MVVKLSMSIIDFHKYFYCSYIIQKWIISKSMGYPNSRQVVSLLKNNSSEELEKETGLHDKHTQSWLVGCGTWYINVIHEIKGDELHIKKKCILFGAFGKEKKIYKMLCEEKYND